MNEPDMNMPAISGPVAHIDLDAYSRNLALVRAQVSPAEVMAVVKADAYGHGLIPVSRAAVRAGVRWIGCLDTQSGRQLRAAGLVNEIKIFAWSLAPDDDFDGAITASIDLGVSTVHQLEMIAAAAGSRSARVHLKIDTGLHRNGANEHEWPALVARAIELSPQIQLIGIWTHIAEASHADDTASIQAFEHAASVASALGGEFEVRHLAASAASFSRSDARFDLVRVGAFSYGISPGGGISPSSLGLEPVMTLTASVSAVTAETARIAVGFADGIPSAVVGRMSVLVHGRRHPITAIGLDYLSVELAAGSSAVMVGDEVVLFGRGSAGEPTLQEWGDALDTIGEEIVTRLSPTLTRLYTGDAPH